MKSFGRLVAALRPWLNEVVVIGGWAHRLYRMHPYAQTLGYSPLMTLDTDIAVPPQLSVDGRSMAERMRANGFTEELLGDDRPPATHYHLGESRSGFYAEFLTPLRGGDYGRGGNRKATRELGGIVSQQLRHIELLLHDPWHVEFRSEDVRATVQIANPATFLAQKVLIRQKRDRNGRAKDILYMHDTLQLFGAHLPELRRLWTDASPELHARSAATISRSSKDLFDQLSDDIRRAAEISPERDLSPEDIRAACRLGFGQMFGD